MRSLVSDGCGPHGGEWVGVAPPSTQLRHDDRQSSQAEDTPERTRFSRASQGRVASSIHITRGFAISTRVSGARSTFVRVQIATYQVDQQYTHAAGSKDRPGSHER